MDMILKDRMRTAMEDAGYANQSELARRCGVRPSAISMILSGETKSISVDLLYKVTRILGVNAEWLGVGSGPMRGEDKPVADPVLDVLSAMPKDDEDYWRSRGALRPLAMQRMRTHTLC